jgi:5'-nucleotidase
MNIPRMNSRRFLWRLLFFLMIGSSLAFGGGPTRILLSNDDGFRDPGLKVLVAKLAPLGELIVAAPSVNQSGVGHGMTFKEPFAVESWTSDGVRWYSIAALPATCVRIALANLLDRPPDILVAGINQGENVGVVTFSSGTVACAREAAFRKIPGISVNLQRGAVMDYEGVADFVVRLLVDLKENGLTPGTYLNVNYPALSRDQVKGVLATRQDTRAPNERYEKTLTPQGKVAYQSVWVPLTDGDPDTDTGALGRGFISVTPLRVDQTKASELVALKSWRCFKTPPEPTKTRSGCG